jgi:hypothetical protein
MSRYHLTGLLFESGGEPKGGTLARFAFDPDFTLHKSHQLLGNGKAQAPTAVLATGGTIGLAECLKKAALGLEWYADAAVLHFNSNFCVRLGFRSLENPNDYLTFACEFQGVADQVGQDLAQPSRIPAQSGWDLRLDCACQLNAFSEGEFGQQVQGAFDRFDQIKIERFEQEFAGLDF